MEAKEPTCMTNNERMIELQLKKNKLSEYGGGGQRLLQLRK